MIGGHHIGETGSGFSWGLIPRSRFGHFLKHERIEIFFVFALRRIGGLIHEMQDTPPAAGTYEFLV